MHHFFQFLSFHQVCQSRQSLVSKFFFKTTFSAHFQLHITTLVAFTQNMHIYKRFKVKKILPRISIFSIKNHNKSTGYPIRDHFHRNTFHAAKNTASEQNLLSSRFWFQVFFAFNLKSTILMVYLEHTFSTGAGLHWLFFLSHRKVNVTQKMSY